ncbi:hypothetical protein [Nakamurella lactea]|uniref:hypothetical protein n=1 Tax=Nakamurella lactea TaxID=459515 RepID=UPI0004074C16|nr:hypothetical protein [Nakamurella lactea]
MDPVLIVILIVVLVGAAIYFSRGRGTKIAAASLDDSKAEARRWIERLGGQVLSLDAKGNEAAQQALSDASERYNAAGSQIEQATTSRQAELAQHTAYEGLYYVRAARTTLGMDPGPEIPAIPGQAQAGAVTEQRDVTIEGREYVASPSAGDRTRYYYPGGQVAGRPVPRGWYSEPWWKPALVAGAWGAGSYLVATSLFAGMAGVGGYYGDGSYADGYQDGLDAGDAGDQGPGGDGYDGAGDGFDGGDSGFDGGGDSGFDSGGDFGGFDF